MVDWRARLPRWFGKSRFALIASYADELGAPPPEGIADLRARLERSIRYGARLMRIRIAVTLLLALGIIAAALSAIARSWQWTGGDVVDVEGALRTLERLTTLSASASLVLLGLRLALDRYIGLAETSATFLAIQIAASRHDPRA